MTIATAFQRIIRRMRSSICLVAREVRLLLGRDGVDVSRRGQWRQAKVVLARALQEPVEDELSPRATLSLDDGVE